MTKNAESSTQHERLVQEGDIAADYLEELLDIADLGGDIDIDLDHGRASIAIVASEDGDEDEDQEDSDTFPRAYVKRLRERSTGYRLRAKTAEERASKLERELFTERVRALDVLADPTDLEFNADLLDDRDALEAAVTDHWPKPEGCD